MNEKEHSQYSPIFVPEIPEIIEEHYSGNYIKILHYHRDNGWCFGYQLHVADIIRAKYPPGDKIAFARKAEATAAAKKEILEILESNRKAKALINNFIVIFQNQLEFDFG